jgi:hypothetical protein
MSMNMKPPELAVTPLLDDESPTSLDVDLNPTALNPVDAHLGYKDTLSNSPEPDSWEEEPEFADGHGSVLEEPVCDLIEDLSFLMPPDGDVDHCYIVASLTPDSQNCLSMLPGSLSLMEGRSHRRINKSIDGAYRNSRQRDVGPLSTLVTKRGEGDVNI